MNKQRDCCYDSVQGKVRGAHGMLFFVLVFTMFPQMLLGYYAKKKDSFHWTKLHRGLGYFVVGTACWQMWLGMQLFETDTRLVQCFYAWLISVGVRIPHTMRP